MQAGLFQNPVIGQSSGLLFPFSTGAGFPSVDGNIQQVLNTFFNQPTKVRIARLQEIQANIDLSTQAFALAQQVGGKYQEMIHLLRARKLAGRIQDLYARAVSAAEARQRVGIIPTPELNRARLNFDDARRQSQHLASQYNRAAREMNWLIGYTSPPQWHLPEDVVEDVSGVPALTQSQLLEQLALRYRLDLFRADFDRKLGEQGVKQARLAMIPTITVAGEVARDSSHHVAGGPLLVGIALPIFDPGIVNLELAKAQQRRADKTFAALEGQVHQDVRTAFDNWRIAGDDLTFYRERLIPQQEENVRLMEVSFRLGNDDLDTLLNVYQNYVQQLQAYEDAIQSVHDTGIALQQAVGLTWRRILDEAGIQKPATPPATLPSPGVQPATIPAGAQPVPDVPLIPEPLPGKPAPADLRPVDPARNPIPFELLAGEVIP